MSTILDAPERAAFGNDKAAFHRAVWDKIVADPELAKLPYRIETDQFGQIIMSPPPAPSHGSWQSRIVRLLGNLMDVGEVVTECPIVTAGGVKAADVAWCSTGIWEEGKDRSCFPRAPEICVEVLSPSNTEGEITEKKRLYFEAGAEEVWLCSKMGRMEFFYGAESGVEEVSRICPGFPREVGRD